MIGDNGRVASTSDTHPLRISSVTAEVGRIGLTFCPGKKQLYAASGSWDRDLRLDLDVVENWGASALVCLLGSAELTYLQVDALPAEARSRGLDWFHLPIADGSVPDRMFESTWTYAGERLREMLERGESIVIFCKGGLGRTGTIAARLLVELGEQPESAIEQVRAARPNAIENDEQEEHVRSIQPVSNAMYRRRVLGCLLGGAVGDAFGYEVEFDRLEEIRGEHGPDGLQEPVLNKGKLVVSDDTQMTLFTLEGLLDAVDEDVPTIVEHTRLAYLDWLVTQSGAVPGHEIVGTLGVEPVLCVQRAPGNTCISALVSGGHGTPERPANDRKGCGGVMRVAPIGLIERFDSAAAFEVAARAAAITHTHPTGYLAAGHMAATVRELVGGLPIAESAENGLRLLEAWDGEDETVDAVRSALTLSVKRPASHFEAVASLGHGWVAEEALAIGLHAALVGSDFPDVLRIAANHDGDSDSTASIAAQLYGAEHGFSTLPHEWVSALDVYSPAMICIARLFQREALGHS